MIRHVTFGYLISWWALVGLSRRSFTIWLKLQTSNLVHLLIRWLLTRKLKFVRKRAVAWVTWLTFKFSYPFNIFETVDAKHIKSADTHWPRPVLAWITLRVPLCVVLLPVSTNKRPPYWNSTSGFDFDLFTVIGMWFCTGLSIFTQFGWSPTKLWSTEFEVCSCSHSEQENGNK